MLSNTMRFESLSFGLRVVFVRSACVRDSLLRLSSRIKEVATDSPTF